MGSISPVEQTLKSRPFRKVLIVGAGPAVWSRFPSPRYPIWHASVTHIPESGILGDVRTVSIPDLKGIHWRTVRSERKLVAVDLSLTRDDSDRITVLPLSEILEISYRHCQKWNVEVKFEHKVLGFRQGKGKAWVEAEVGQERGDGGRKETFEADYVIGCDGAISRIRQEFFGEWIHLGAFYDGFVKHGWSGGDYVIDPDHRGMMAERKTGLWRVTYGGDISGLEPEEYLKRWDLHLEAMFPGHLKPGEYKIEQVNKFKVQNRCVKTRCVGRVLLAADTVHLCNPFGGYVAITGILDVGALADCLIGYYDGRAGEEILDLYAKIRRQKFFEFVDRRSIKNMKWLYGLDPKRALEEYKFLQMLNDLEKVPEKIKTFLLKDSSIVHEFT